MTIRPRAPKDLMLAPVAAEIDLNLQVLRDKTTDGIDEALTLAFNVDARESTAEQRKAWILDYALRTVELHDWQSEITSDAARLKLSGGSVSIDLGLSATILKYITEGP